MRKRDNEKPSGHRRIFVNLPRFEIYIRVDFQPPSFKTPSDFLTKRTQYPLLCISSQITIFNALEQPGRGDFFPPTIHSRTIWYCCNHITQYIPIRQTHNRVLPTSNIIYAAARPTTQRPDHDPSGPYSNFRCRNDKLLPTRLYRKYYHTQNCILNLREEKNTLATLET